MIYVLYLNPDDDGSLCIRENQGEFQICITASSVETQMLIVLILESGYEAYIAVGGYVGGASYIDGFNYIAWQAQSSGDLEVHGYYWAFN